MNDLVEWWSNHCAAQGPYDTGEESSIDSSVTTLLPLFLRTRDIPLEDRESDGSDRAAGPISLWV
jgi:hypothetical protein